MKKLEKLTLKELENSTVVMSSDEERRSIVAGSDVYGSGSYDPNQSNRDYGGFANPVSFNGAMTNMLPEYTCSGKDALYGNFLGPSVNADPQTLGLVPVNQLDSACYNHDEAYYSLGASGVIGALFNPSVVFADAQLANDAWQAATNNDNDILQRVVAVGTAVVFGAISAVKIDSLTP